MERDIQTDEIESEEKWSQHPAVDMTSVGGPHGTSPLTSYDQVESQLAASLLRIL